MDTISRGAAKHIPALDGIRGIAILLVLAIHLQVSGAFPRWPLGFARFNEVLYLGWSGVDLFFVLSGFLITGILLDTKERAGRARIFYARRALRIFPLFYFAVFVGMMLTPFLRDSPKLYGGGFPSWKEWGLYLCYLQNWTIPITKHGIIAHFWSLGVEEQFYLLWPWAVWTLPRKLLPWACLAGIVAAPCIRIAVLHFAAAKSDVPLMNTFCRMDTLLFGALCAMAVRSERWSKISKRLIVPSSVLALAVMAAIELRAHELLKNVGPWTASVGYTAVALGYSALLLAAYFQSGSGSVLARIFEFPFLRFCGKYSYGLYVWHWPLFVLGIFCFQDSPWWGQSFRIAALFSLVVSLVSILVAVLSYECYEKWFLRAKPQFQTY